VYFLLVRLILLGTGLSNHRFAKISEVSRWIAKMDPLRSLDLTELQQ